MIEIKKISRILKVKFFACALICILINCNTYAQKQFIHIATKANGNCNDNCTLLDIPELNNNPVAIIWATPVSDNGINFNPHPIGVFYFKNKWNIFNLDQTAIAQGSKFNVEYVARPDENHFLYVIKTENLLKAGSTYLRDGTASIDNPKLNNNPNAKFYVFANWNPIGQGGIANRDETKQDYDPATGKWHISNINKKELYERVTYNIIISAAENAVTQDKGNQDVSIKDPKKPADTIVAIDKPKDVNKIIPQKPAEIITPIDKPTDVNKIIPKKPEEKITAIEKPTEQKKIIPKEPVPVRLNGFVDMHTHPMSYLAFGKRLLHGAPDIGLIIPAGTRNCNPLDFRATTINEALGNCSSTHGGWGLNNNCGDHVRAFVLNNLFDDKLDFKLKNDLFNGGNLLGDHEHEGIETNPNFLYWPSQTSKTHQQMWWEWIKRAKEKGNLRVMVALTVNSELLAEVLNGDSPKDDKASADLQIDELKTFVKRQKDWMEIALTPVDLRRIVGEGKLAVIIGMEVDNIGNFNRLGAVVNEATVKAEIQRLYTKGVRYVFPIHLLDNKFGGTAIYSNLFNMATKFSTNSFYKVESSTIKYRLGISPAIGGDFSVIQGIPVTLDAMSGTPYPPAFQGDPFKAGYCPVPILGCWKTFQIVRSLFTPDPAYLIYSAIPGGHVNAKGLTNIGKIAIKEMMKLGMIIDIDHMSDKSQNETLNSAEQFQYPVNIGHNGIRKQTGSERHALEATVERIAKLGGVFGVGTSDSEEHNSDAATFINSFNEVWSVMARNGGIPRVAMGTDVNGMERLPRASKNIPDSAQFYSAHYYADIPDNMEDDFQKCITGNRQWDYTREGVAHYGLMADFIRDVRKRNVSVQQRLMDAAEYFAQMWEKCNTSKVNVQ